MIPILIVASHLGISVWDFIGVNSHLCVLPGQYCQDMNAVGSIATYFMPFNGLKVTYEKNAWRIAVTQDQPYPGLTRKFTGTFLPSSIPNYAYLPVVTEEEFSHIGPIGDTVFTLSPFQVWYVYNSNYSQYIGSITSSGYAFILDSYDFGGTIGLQRNILGIEHLGGYPQGAKDPAKAIRYERYLFVQGLGMVYAGGWEDGPCRQAPSLSSCTGNYSVPAPGATVWRYTN